MSMMYRRKAGIALRAGAVLLALLGTSCSPSTTDPAQSSSPAVAVPPSPTGPSFAREVRPLLVAKMKELRVPGAVVLVDVPGQGLWLDALGVGDIKTGGPMAVADHVRIGSITKTMTATLALQLVDEGKISLDAPVSAYIAGVPNGSKITIRELLNMTSGLYSYNDDDDFNRALEASPRRVWKYDEILKYAYSHPVTAPGKEYSYSNTNYVLLGMIAEKLTRRSLPALFRERLFEPLGMRDSRFPDPPDASLPAPYAHGYDFAGPLQIGRAINAAVAGDASAGITAPAGAQPSDTTGWNPSWATSAGAVISTAKDLRIWAEALATGSLLKPATQTERLQHDGSPYGLGVGIFPNGAIGHTGVLPGYQSHMQFLPARKAVLIVLTNLQAAPNVPWAKALPADQLAQIITKHLALGGT
ncbi:serine hydrolase [Streptomyces sp. NPDC008121]|uniref:serine hydrolase domain-containing protein n=1 Tax=Streptomyces sp. NPDC008121 TaxID=3364809 RepID=UPI0036EADFB3